YPHRSYCAQTSTRCDTHLPSLREYKEQGRIGYFGVTSTGRNQDDLTRWMDDLDFVEFAYAVDAREAEQRLLPMAADKGVATFIALPLGRGRLLSAMRGKEVPEWAKEELNCHSFAQLLLKFVVSHPNVTAAIPGTGNPRHMAENLDAGRPPLANAKQRERIAAIWENA
ncbi:MAG: aldo/keto reductase, partial [Rhodospirillaceae bacterium]